VPSEAGQIPMHEPLAYFLTWTTYGTWLPGDERGWVEKPSIFRPPDAQLKESSRHLMTEPPLTLGDEQRRVIEDTIAKHCRIRGWRLHAINARRQHVHVIVTAPGRTPEDVMNQFKAWCTRRLKELEHSRLAPEGQGPAKLVDTTRKQEMAKRHLQPRRCNSLCARRARRTNPATAAIGAMHTSLERKPRALRLRFRLVSYCVVS